MGEITDILERYQHADLDTRLYMMLEHRDLRHVFDQIETDELPVPAEAGKPIGGGLAYRRESTAACLRRWLGGCCPRGV